MKREDLMIRAEIDFKQDSVYGVEVGNLKSALLEKCKDVIETLVPQIDRSGNNGQKLVLEMVACEFRAMREYYSEREY